MLVAFIAKRSGFHVTRILSIIMIAFDAVLLTCVGISHPHVLEMDGRTKWAVVRVSAINLACC